MKIGIVGAGACGLACATVLEKNNIEYMIFEKNKKPGSKILASGNGRCNIMNTNNFYDIDNHYLLDFLAINQCPIYEDLEGRCYPVSNSSQTILDLFLSKINQEKLLLDKPVLEIKKVKDKYYIYDYKFDKLVLASGSYANLLLEKKDIVTNYLKNLNLNLTPLKPSLVGFKTNIDITLLNGLRLKCEALLYNDGKLIKKESGEVQFKKDGISGIVIMNLSYYYNKIKKLNNPYIKLNINPDINYSDYSTTRFILPFNAYNYFLKNKINPNSFIIPISGTYDSSFAQVMAGGVALDCVDSNYRLKNDYNIYIGGELLDIDYPCGGYNLSSAFSSGFKIGENICGI